MSIQHLATTSTLAFSIQHPAFSINISINISFRHRREIFTQNMGLTEKRVSGQVLFQAVPGGDLADTVRNLPILPAIVLYNILYCNFGMGNFLGKC
jgi:hypothetical protein